MNPNPSDKHSSQQDFSEASPLKVESRRFEEIFERAIAEVEDYAILLLDVNGNIRTWNRAAEKIKGYSASEIIGKNFNLFYSKEDRDAQLPEKFLNTVRKEGKINHDGWRIRKDGSRFWGHVTITAIHDDSGEVKGFMKVTCDLTQKKIADDNAANYVEILSQKNEELRKSEERYHKMVFEVQDYAIILLDENGIIRDWNKGAEKLKGYAANEIIGKSFHAFYPRENLAAGLPDQLLDQARKDGSVTHEGWRIRKDGSSFWGSVAITALHGDEGKIIGFSKVTKDLTDQKNAEDKLNAFSEDLKQKNETLRQSREILSKMIAEVEDYAIILLNKKGEIQTWNAGAERIKGYSADEITGKNFEVFYPLEDRKNKLPQHLLDLAAKTGKATHEGWRVKKEGRFWGSIVITALHDADGKVIGFTKVTRDLTERKLAEDGLKETAAQLEIKNKTLERVNRELESFTWVASHDLKEPLRKIQVFAARLKQNDEPRDKEYLERIEKTASRMQNLIEDLLSYSKVAKDTSEFERVDLNKIVEEVENDLELVIVEKKVVIQYSSLPTIRGVPFQLHQLFLNLLSNSIKFSKNAEPALIKISSRVIKSDEIPVAIPAGNPAYHEISVSDSGIGFSSESSSKIFDAFQRLHSAKTFAGTGIGLSIVKQVAENHRGAVMADGQLGVGATFHIYLPVVDAD